MALPKLDMAGGRVPTWDDLGSELTDMLQHFRGTERRQVHGYALALRRRLREDGRDDLVKFLPCGNCMKVGCNCGGFGE